MAFIVPGVARYTVNGIYDGRPFANVFDSRIDTTGSVESREDAVRDQARVLIDRWTADITPLIVNECQADSVSWVDLDEADGTTGSVTAGNTATWPDSGNVTTPGHPGNVSILATKQVQSARGRRNGRSFFVGVPEDTTADGTPSSVSGGTVTAWNTALASFLAGFNQDGSGVLDYQSNLCVVHILTRGPDTPEGNPGPPLTGDSNDVEDFIISARLATQRRRLRG